MTALHRPQGRQLKVVRVQKGDRVVLVNLLMGDDTSREQLEEQVLTARVAHLELPGCAVAASSGAAWLACGVNHRD